VVLRIFFGKSPSGFLEVMVIEGHTDTIVLLVVAHRTLRRLYLSSL